MKKQKIVSPMTLLGVIVFSAASVIQAEVIRGIEFPQGLLSFADRVVSHEPRFSGGAVPSRNLNPNFALGAPNYPNSDDTDDYSMGSGGRLTLEFLNNLLTGSGTEEHDLHIFEVGPQVERMAVEISKDGIEWHSVGNVSGGVSSVDIDSFGFTQFDEFHFVRLTDDPNDGDRSGAYVGADIDAVGAISSKRNEHAPELLLLESAIQVSWSSYFGSLYFIERSVDGLEWEAVSAAIPGDGGILSRFFEKTESPTSYRVTTYGAGVVPGTFGGVVFPQGAISFADSVVSYEPANPSQISSYWRNPSLALGAPDWNVSTDRESVSLGSGGNIVLKFENNVLTGSNDSRADIHIFEIGPSVESTFVDISEDGVIWHSVGGVFGGTSFIDIDAFGFTAADSFNYVRLTDDPNQGGTSAGSPGADIDAVGAISSYANEQQPVYRTSDAFVLSFETLQGSSYSIEESSSGVDWHDVVTEIVGDGSRKRHFLELNGGVKFYRVSSY